MQFLNSSLTSVDSILVIDSKDFFQPELLPHLGPPYNLGFTYK
jgi:hypothetical protein